MWTVTIVAYFQQLAIAIAIFDLKGLYAVYMLASRSHKILVQIIAVLHVFRLLRTDLLQYFFVSIVFFYVALSPGEQEGGVLWH